MLYSRTFKGKLVTSDQLVGTREHLSVQHRILHVTGVITGETDFSAMLLALDSLSHDPIKLVIDSPGGDLDTTFMYNDVFNLIQSPVYTLGRMCCSAACLMLASGEKGHRYLMPHGRIMLHLPSAYFRGNTAMDTTDLEIQKQQIMLSQEHLLKILRDGGVTKSDSEILFDLDRAFWLEPQEAIDYGLADEIMNKETLASWLEKKEEVGYKI